MAKMLLQHPKYHVRTPETRRRVRTDDAATRDRLLAEGWTEVPDPRAPLSDVVDKAQADKLAAAGFRTQGDVMNATDEDLSAVEGVGKKTIADLRGTKE